MKKEQGISTRHKSSVRIKNTSSGITLIALVITIVVLLILAGASIALVVGENGILNQATNAVNENEKAEEGEKIKLAAAASIDTNDLKVKEEALREELDKSFGSGNYELTEETGYYLVTIKSSGRKYKIDSYGNVTAINSNGDEAEYSEGPTSITIEGERTLNFSIYGETTTTLYACDQNGIRIEGPEVIWTSSDTSIATVNEEAAYGEYGMGVVWVYGLGTVTIRATSAADSSVYDEITITVHDGSYINPDDAPTSIIIEGENSIQMDIYSESTTTLYAFDQNGVRIEGPEVIWTSSDTSIATVNEEAAYGEHGMGVVWVYGPGTVTIRATSAFDSSIYDEITITVYDNPYANIPTSINIEISSTTITKGSSGRIYAKDGDGEYLDDYDIVWTSSDSSIATVVPYYEGAWWFDLVCTQTGTVTITATSRYNSSVYGTVTINVVE